MSATLSDGGVRVVLVVGEPGLGKTRLIEAAASTAHERGFRIVKTRSHEVDRTRPYAAWREAIGTIAPPAGSAPGGDDSASEAAHRERFLAEASERILGGPDVVSPTLIVLDDVQWCDTASLDLLHALTSGQRPLLVILGARSGELADNPAVLQLLRGLRHDRMLDEMRLEPLGAEALATLVRSVAPEADTSRVAVESGGNPFFAIELARHALHDASGLPRPLKQLIRDRVDVFHSGCVGASALMRSSAKASWVYIGCSAQSVPSLSKTAMRSAGGTKSGPPCLVVRSTKSTSAFLDALSFHDGSGSPAGVPLRCASAVGVVAC